MPDETGARPADKADFLFRVADKTADQLRVIAFSGREEMSQLFHFRIEMCSDDPTLDIATLIGKPCTLTILGSSGERHVNGIVRQFERLGEATHLAYYAAEVVPVQWLLTRRQQCRIFQSHNCSDMTVPGIIKKVFESAGVTTDYFRDALQGSHTAREYVVQYRESDFDFISRLMEEEGIFYFFEHTIDGHKMVLADTASAHVALPNCAEAPFREKTGMVTDQSKEFFHSVRERVQIQPGKASLDDFNFEAVTTPLEVTKSGSEYTALELSDYPGRYVEKAVGTSFVDYRLQEHQCRKQVFSLSGAVRALVPGFKLSIVEHPNENLNKEFLLIGVTHRGFQPQSAEAEAGGGRGLEYFAEAEALLATVEYRPARVTPRPVVHGSQTAIVVGPSGEEIFPDKYGRVKVQFHWDREGTYNENSSCWIRVSQGLAGGRYGMMFLPRVGQEVVVDFLEGDADRPIIIGRVYNNDQMPPYTLPDEKTKSTIKTNSSTGGGETNEIRFEDKAGSEQLLIFAGKDLHLRSRNDTVHTVEANMGHGIGGDLNQSVGGSRSVKVSKDDNLEVGAKRSMKVSGNLMEDIGGAHSETVGGERFISANSFIVEAKSSISLKVGGNFVVIGAAGVQIKGALVLINSGGAAIPSSIADSLKAPAGPAEADEVTPGADKTYQASPVEGEQITVEKLPQPPEEEETEEEKEPTWCEFQLVDDLNNPVPDEPFIVRLSDKTEQSGTTDTEGLVRVELPYGQTARISFPNRGDDEWEYERTVGPNATGGDGGTNGGGTGTGGTGTGAATPSGTPGA